jgi:hypothetical protein
MRHRSLIRRFLQDSIREMKFVRHAVTMVDRQPLSEAQALADAEVLGFRQHRGAQGDVRQAEAAVPHWHACC